MEMMTKDQYRLYWHEEARKNGVNPTMESMIDLLWRLLEKNGKTVDYAQAVVNIRETTASLLDDLHVAMIAGDSERILDKTTRVRRGARKGYEVKTKA